MTPREYKKIYQQFLRDDDVYYVSEHRGSFNNDKELKNYITGNKDIIIMAISITRFEAIKAKKILEKMGYKIGLVHVLWIKPFKVPKKTFEAIKRSKKGAILLDDDYVDGISNSLANRINLKTGKKIYTMGLKDKTAGAHAKVDNLPPSAKEIVKKVTRILNEKK